MSRINRRKYDLFPFIGFLLLLCILVNNLGGNMNFFIINNKNSYWNDNENLIGLERNKYLLKNANYWTNTTIIIDDYAKINTSNSGDWDWAVSQPWCSGLGTPETPYVIENITYNPGSADYGLAINNSRSVYFELNNISIQGAIDPDKDGLLIINSTNGLIQNCNLSYNFHGIHLKNYCENITIKNNNISYSTCSSSSPIYNAVGIYLENECNNNKIINNNGEKYDGRMYYGIYLNDNCAHNLIKNNNLTLCSYSQIYLKNQCNNNTLINNLLKGGNQGIYIYDTSNQNKILNNTIINSGHGIELRTSSSLNDIYDNNISSGSSTSYGIYCSNANSNKIIRNNISVGAYGIRVQINSDDTIVINNTIQLNGISPRSIYITDSRNAYISNNSMDWGIFLDGTEQTVNSHIIHRNNTARGKPIYYYINQNSLLPIDFINAGQIILVSSENCEISNNLFQDVSVAIQLLYCNDTLIKKNIINNCINGIYQKGGRNSIIIDNDLDDNTAGLDLENTDFNYIENNTANNNGNYGIWLDFYCENNTIVGNQATYNGLGGIHIRNSYNTTLFNNTFTNNNRGIELFGAKDTKILENYLLDNYFGVLIQQNAINNLVRNNSIVGNTEGIYLTSNADFNIARKNFISGNNRGICINDAGSSDNIIFWNAFISNNVQATDDGTNTNWTNGLYGNYWSDYLGNDTNGDGVGEQPYLIPPNSQDNKPLTFNPLLVQITFYPDLNIIQSSIVNGILNIQINNTGNNNASGVVIVVYINNLALTLYNNTLNPIDLIIDEGISLSINLTDFTQYFINNTLYEITIHIDPLDLIQEMNKSNNLKNIPYLFITIFDPINQDEDNHFFSTLFLVLGISIPFFGVFIGSLFILKKRKRIT